MREGRPLRFLAATLAGWVGLRVFLLWPAADDLVGPGAFAAPVEAPTAAPARVVVAVAPSIHARPRRRSAFPTAEPRRPLQVARAAIFAPAPPPMVGAGVSAMSSSAPPAAPPAGESRQAALVAPAPPPANASRWSAGLWTIARPDGTGAGLNASQLGGSQAGARVAYALGGARRVSIVGRIATPLEGRAREAALGVEWRPTRLPVRLFAERRVALGGGRGGPSAGLVAGAYEPLPHGFRLEAYGQAGVIDRRRTEGFADGAARVVRAAAGLGPATLDVGVGAWGGAQRGAERLDVGPTLGVAAPVAGRTVRLTLDYRARVAGRARPGSGPALSLGADF